MGALTACDNESVVIDYLRSDRAVFANTECCILLRRLNQIRAGEKLSYQPRITPLEMAQPWRYRSWNRLGEADKPSVIPDGMRS
jgi:hypothetical protein